MSKRKRDAAVPAANKNKRVKTTLLPERESFFQHRRWMLKHASFETMRFIAKSLDLPLTGMYRSVNRMLWSTYWKTHLPAYNNIEKKFTELLKLHLQKQRMGSKLHHAVKCSYLNTHIYCVVKIRDEWCASINGLPSQQTSYIVPARICDVKPPTLKEMVETPASRLIEVQLKIDRPIAIKYRTVECDTSFTITADTRFILSGRPNKCIGYEKSLLCDHAIEGVSVSLHYEINELAIDLREKLRNYLFESIDLINIIVEYSLNV